jgi:hypothetical protein
MKIKILLFFIFFSNFAKGQYSSSKEWSKESAQFYAKEFLFKEVLDSTKEVTIFELVPLAAANSGELTTLFYKTLDGKKEGLILGFFGNMVNEFGLQYKGYRYKNIEKESAVNILESVKSNIENLKLYWEKEDFNLHFKINDLDFLVFKITGGYELRVFWNDFDATWEQTAFERSVKRFKKRI